MAFEGKTVTDTESPYVNKFLEFLEANYKKEIERLVESYPDSRSLDVDFRVLEQFDIELADALLDAPDTLLETAEQAVEQIEVPALEIERFSPHIRFFNLPKEHEPLVRNIGAKQLGKLIAVEGIVRQITTVMPKLETAVWRCRHCGNTYKKPQDGQQLATPAFCECRHRDFDLVPEQSEFIDSQKIQIQEPLEKLKGNEQASTLDIYVSDDLVNSISAGDKTRFVGVLRLYPPDKKKTVYGRYLEALHLEETQREFEDVEITPEEEKEIRKLAEDPKIYEKLVKSVAPAIYGHENVKESIILQLFGGVKKALPGNQTIRGNAHVLLVGDPGCLVSDERVVLGNGAIERIGDLGQKHLEEINQPVLTGEGGAKRDLATVFHYYKNQPVIEIVTESGKSIKGTANHPLLCVSKDDVWLTREWKRLDEFEIGDKVAVVTGIPCSVTGFIETGFSPSPYKGGNKFKGKLPKKMTPELAAFLGYMVGDGWVRKYETAFVVSEDEKDLLEPLLGMGEELFGIRPSVVRRKLPGRTVWLSYASIYSKDVSENLKFLREKRIPKLVMRSGNKVAATFLKWLYEADGCVFSKGRGRRAISFKAKNIELLRDMQLLLLRFGIHSRIVENMLQIRRGREIIKFAEKIGFASEKKICRLKKIKEDAQSFKRFRLQRSERIVKIAKHKPEDVFDIEVPNSHRFIANGIVSHNTGKSQILQAADNIAPKSIYTAGKTTSGVGLTASAVKDDFGEGGWTLKAGALVLSSGGVCMIDELDKMDAEDRSAMHEAMEQGMISIAKAGIVTRFKSDTSILAAANPKMSRFEQYTPFIEQINLPPTLISRFDLFFMIRDVLDKTRDEAITAHILKTHKGGELLSQYKKKGKTLEKQVQEDIEAISAPQVNPELLAKYISFARQNIFPVMSREAVQAISEFYIGLRDIGRKEGSYAATHRQLEGLVRLSEASARVRLSDEAGKEDAERAIRLVKASLSDVVTDPETGKIDYDIIMTGQTHTQVTNMRKILEIVREKAGEQELVPLQEVLAEAEGAGINKDRAHDLIAKLEKNGELYRPRHNFLKPTQRD
jgi:replicative DNA helicase Mcm